MCASAAAHKDVLCVCYVRSTCEGEEEHYPGEGEREKDNGMASTGSTRRRRRGKWRRGKRRIETGVKGIRNTSADAAAWVALFRRQKWRYYSDGGWLVLGSLPILQQLSMTRTEFMASERGGDVGTVPGTNCVRVPCSIFAHFLQRGWENLAFCFSTTSGSRMSQSSNRKEGVEL